MPSPRPSVLVGKRCRPSHAEFLSRRRGTTGRPRHTNSDTKGSGPQQGERACRRAARSVPSPVRGVSGRTYVKLSAGKTDLFHQQQQRRRQKKERRRDTREERREGTDVSRRATSRAALLGRRTPEQPGHTSTHRQSEGGGGAQGERESERESSHQQHREPLE